MNLKPFPNFPKSDPKFYNSQNKIVGSPIVVMVHFYGGQQRILSRHIQILNDLGYDVFAYNMPSFAGSKLSLFYKGRFGLKHLFSHMLSYFLDQLPGKKIIFSFSNPSAAAIEVIYDRTKENRNDVVGLICDSGPSQAFIRSAWNLAFSLRGQNSLLALFAVAWSLFLHQEIRYQLRRFPLQFPILSIRGQLDPIIPPWHIEKIFKKMESYIFVTAIIFEQAGHLDACKKEPEVYKAVLKKWLETYFEHSSAD